MQSLLYRLEVMPMALQVWMPLTDSVNNQGLSNNITIENNGPVISNQGKIGSCYQFDGEDDYISLIGDELYTAIRGGTHPFSVAFWVYHNDDTRAIILGDYMLPGAINFNIELLANHTVRFYWNATPNKIFANSSVGLQTWAHVAIVYTGTEVDLYVNGALISDKYIGTLQERVKTDGYYYLGRDNRTGATVLNGRLNDFRIYDHALSAKEVHLISQGLVAHYPLNREGFGNDNLIINSKNKNVSHLESGNEYIAINVGQSYMDVPDGTRVTISFDIEIEYKKPYSTNYFQIYNTNNKGPKQVVSVNIGGLVFGGETVGTTIKKRVYAVTTIKDRSSSEVTVQNNFLEFYSKYNTGNVFAISNLKMELGSTPTLWTPNPADSLYSALGLDDNIIADVSGYRHNGTLHNITYSTDTPKYNLCSEFKSANTSYVKCNDSDWMVEKATDITINFWASTDDWTLQTSPRLFSCTEGGGFNTEGGSSGYIRFPCNVYTNNAGTKAYKYTNTFLKLSDLSAGFHMFTFIYNITGQKLYIDGKLYNDYQFTSYGLHYNKDARLFLGCEANTANPAAPYTDMKMSDFRIYATTLSPESILELYNSPISVANTGSLLTSGEFSEGL